MLNRLFDLLSRISLWWLALKSAVRLWYTAHKPKGLYRLWKIPKGAICLLSTRRQLKKAVMRRLGITTGRQWRKYKKGQQLSNPGVRFKDIPIKYYALIPKKRKKA